MAEELSEAIQDFIESISLTSQKEQLYIVKNNWVDIEDPSIREEEYKLQELLISRSISHASNLFTLAKADLKHPTVKKMLDNLLEGFVVHRERVSKYLMESDWTDQLLQGASRGSMKNEIEFQSEINKNLAKSKADVRKLNYSDEAQSVDIQIYGSGIIPLLMSQQMESRYVEITEFLAKKREKFYKENPKQVVVEEKPKKVRKPVKKFKLQKLPTQE